MFRLNRADAAKHIDRSATHNHKSEKKTNRQPICNIEFKLLRYLNLLK